LNFLGDDVDSWEKEEWEEEIEKHQVLCMVHDVFKIALNRSYFHMDRVNLLIVDECHHSFGNSSYNQIFTGHYHPLKELCPCKIYFYVSWH
jgi:endoribonuclease Dicer